MNNKKLQQSGLEVINVNDINTKLKYCKEKIDYLMSALSSCNICPHSCGVDRLNGEVGFCRAGRWAVVSSYGRHMGEESVLVGTKGSGTIFFAHCNMKCVYCQNYEISHLGEGRAVSSEELADIMLYLQNIGCHNINFVSPTHFVLQIVESLIIALDKGLNIPLVYNTGGYDALNTIKSLNNIIDIYMPDIKYGDDDTAKSYSSVKGYFTNIKKILIEMYNQVGSLKCDERGIAIKGLMIRHLVLPNDLANSSKVFDFLAKELPKDTFINIMNQYYPAHRAKEYPELSRTITREEYTESIKQALQRGLLNIC
ncbi:radical SAM protein [Peptococcaceae bacterium]|nr:radical SAM protein [Peptococcaceae bacterium]